MNWLINLGYWGLFLGAFLAGTILPFSSDILLNGGLAIGLKPWLAMIITTLGNWIGLASTYGLGWLGRWEWIEKWGRVTRDDLLRQKVKIDKYGVWIAFFTWIPVVGIVGLVALGFYRVKPRLTLLFLFIACISRFFTWTYLYVNYGIKVLEWMFGK